MPARVFLPVNVQSYVIAGQTKPRPADGIVQCTTRGELLDMLMQGAETISVSTPRATPANLTDDQVAAQAAAGITGLPAAALTESVCSALPALVSGDGIFLGSGGLTGKRSFSAASGYIRTAAEYRALQASFSQPVNAAQPTARFVDFNRGNDANDGLTPKTPKKNITALDNLTLGAGSVIALASDSEWTLAQTGASDAHIRAQGFSGSSGNPCIMTAYDPAGVSGTKPKINQYWSPVAGDWTWDATKGMWYVTTASAPSTSFVMVKFADGSFGIWNRDPVGNGASDRQYYLVIGTAKIWVYAPSTTDPTTYYGGVMLCNDNKGIFYSYEGGGYLTIDGIDLGTGALLFKPNCGSTSAAIAGHVLKNCTSYSGRLFHILSGCNNGNDYSATLTGNRGYNIMGPLVHASHGSLAQTGTITLDISDHYIDGCNLGNSAGGAMYLQNRAVSGGATKVYRNVIKNAKNGKGGNFFDGCGIYTDYGATRVDVYANIVQDSARAYQDNSGQTTRWIANAAFDCNTFLTVTDADTGGGGIDSTIAHNAAIRCGYNKIPQGSQAMDWAVIGVWRPSNATVTALRILNNVMTLAPGVTAGDAVQLPNTTTTLDVANNAFYGFGSRLFRNANVSDVTASLTSGNVVMSSDPYTGNSVIPAAGVLDSAGCMRAVYKDLLGNDFARVPSIGCVEVTSA